MKIYYNKKFHFYSASTNFRSFAAELALIAGQRITVAFEQTFVQPSPTAEVIVK